MTTYPNLKAVYEAKDFQAILDATRGSNNADVNAAWALTLTACYGPIGLHDSWRGPDDKPTAEALTKFPQVAQVMEDAWERLGRMVAHKFSGAKVLP